MEPEFITILIVNDENNELALVECIPRDNTSPQSNSVWLDIGRRFGSDSPPPSPIGEEK